MWNTLKYRVLAAWTKLKPALTRNLKLTTTFVVVDLVSFAFGLIPKSISPGLNFFSSIILLSKQETPFFRPKFSKCECFCYWIFWNTAPKVCKKLFVRYLYFLMIISAWEHHKKICKNCTVLLCGVTKPWELQGLFQTKPHLLCSRNLLVRNCNTENVWNSRRKSENPQKLWSVV